MLDIMHGLEKFYHYFFTFDVSKITDPKLVVAICKKDVANLLQTNFEAEWLIPRYCDAKVYIYIYIYVCVCVCVRFSDSVLFKTFLKTLL